MSVITKEWVAVQMAAMKGSILNFAQYARIAEPGERSVPYELWPHLIQLFQALEREKFLWVLKSKKVGVSWALALQALHDIYFIDNAYVIELSHGDLYAQELAQKSKTIYLNFPEWMQRYTLYPDTLEAFGFKENGSKIRAFPSTLTAGIGETGSRVIHDEADFHDYFKENLVHTKATMQDVAGGRLVGVTTIDKTKVDSTFRDEYKLAREGKTNFKTLFFPVWARPGRTEEWYNRERQIAIEGGGLAEFEGNYPRTEDEALSPASAQSAFKKEALDILWDNAYDVEPIRNCIYIYQPFKVGWVYGAGVDVAEGVGQDYSVLTILGRFGGTMEVVALIYSNTIKTDMFAYETNQLCEEYYIPLLGVENNSIGVAVLNKLVELGYKNLFYSDTKRQKPGITATGTRWSSTAQQYLIELTPEVDNGSIITRFPPQIKELMEMQWAKNKPNPSGKTHGDTVFSLFYAQQMLKKVGKPVKITSRVF